MKAATTARSALAAVVALACAARADTTFRPAGAVEKCTTAPEVTIVGRIAMRGVWLGATNGSRCFVPRAHGVLDKAAIDAELRTILASLPADCSRSALLSGDGGTAFQDLVTVMDRVDSLGVPKIDVGTPDALPVTFDDSVGAERGAPHCTAPVSQVKAAPAVSHAGGASAGSSSGSSAAAPAPSKADLDHVPVVVVTKTDASIGATPLGAVKSLGRGKGPIDALVSALGRLASGPHAVIVQADATIDVAIVNRVVASAKKAGFDDVLFAVKSK